MPFQTDRHFWPRKESMSCFWNR